MLWVKSFHIFFVASWFAGLFYLPRLYVNLAMVPKDSDAERARLMLMGDKLFRFMTMIAGPALVLGFWLWLGYGVGKGAYWMHAKLFVVGIVVVYHGYCYVLLKQFRECRVTHGHVWFRWFNELPVFLLVAAILLAVVKPF